MLEPGGFLKLHADDLIQRRLALVRRVNGTTDDSVQVAAQATTDLPVRIIECPSVGYDANARNVAIDEARGEVILFVDADDVVADDYVAEMVATLGHADVVTAIWEYGLLNGDQFPELRADDARFETLPFRYNGWPYAPAGTLGVRREVAREIGGFDARLEMGANNDWCFRARAADHDLVAVPSAVVHYRLRRSWGALFRQRYQWGKGEFAAARAAEALTLPDTPSRSPRRARHRDWSAASALTTSYGRYRAVGTAGQLLGWAAGMLRAHTTQLVLPRRS
jgi:glycosyltransferase involved in cell wall biosynthesis